MTVVMSLVHPELIIVGVDSAVTRIFNDGEFREYDKGRKAYKYSNTGVVATWGARDGNQIGQFLDKQSQLSIEHTIDSLAKAVYEYLMADYQPSERNSDDVGYHVAGFDSHQRPHLYHVMYGLARPHNEDEPDPIYRFLDHSVLGQFLYNGRNDLAESIIRPTVHEIMHGASNFDLNNQLKDWVRLCDFTMRFAAEITPEVNSPFLYHLISPTNDIGVLMNEELKPLDVDQVVNALNEIGCAKSW